MHSQFNSEEPNAALKRYLDRLCPTLTRDIAPQEREALRHKIRTHLLFSAGVCEGGRCVQPNEVDMVE